MKKIISWGSSIPIAQKLIQQIDGELIIPSVDKFQNDETRVFFRSDNLKGDIQILLTFEDEINNKLIETFLVIDAIKRAGGSNINIILPWFPYSPQDEVFREGESLSSEVIIKLFESLGINKFICLDLHSNKLVGYFTSKLINIDPINYYVEYLKKKMTVGKDSWKVAILDDGSNVKAKKLASCLNLDVVVFKKERSRETGKITFSSFNGDVKNQNILVYDDFVSTGSTLFKSAKFLKTKGAKSFNAIVTHAPVGGTLDLVAESYVDKLFVSNTFNYQKDHKGKVEIMDITKLLAEQM